MKLPKLKKRLPQYTQDIMEMGGINYSDKLKPGDMTDSFGISTRRWPYMATRWKRIETQPKGDTTAIFGWDGHRVRVTGGILYYDDKEMTNVAPGEKQFAVVNTKLIIWPDKRYIDLKDNTLGRLDENIRLVSPVFKESTITADIKPPYARNGIERRYGGDASENSFRLYTYGRDPSLIKWSEETGWDLPEPKYTNIWHLRVGDIIIPEVSFSENGHEVYDYPHANDRDPQSALDAQNNLGYYAIVNYAGGYQAFTGSKWDVYSNIYRTSLSNALFSEHFAVGDAVSITGSLNGYLDRENIIIKEIKDATNTLVFSEGMFPLIDGYVEVSKAGAGISAIKRPDETRVYYTAPEDIDRPVTLFIHGLDVTAWDAEKKEVIYKVVGSTDNPGSIPGNRSHVASEYNLETMQIHIERKIPDMDYICESQNRLWGCSNKDRTIYASALGDPKNFFFYDAGEATASYAVAVGSEGEFTGCCKHHNSVLFFKEQQMHKVLGSYPAEYSLYDYPIDGVQKGSYKSLQVIEGTLYYLGTHGVYAYTGGTPYLVSPNFGTKAFSSGVAGNDGDTYYLTVKEGEKKHLYLYETREHIWVREGSDYALDFSRIGRDLRMLLDDGSIQQVETHEDDPDIKWMAQFAPVFETIQGRKSHGKLIIRTELPVGSFMLVEVKRDGGRWEEVQRVVGRANTATSVVLPIGRCDKFEMRLSGEGPCTVMGISRRFRIGSDK